MSDPVWERLKLWYTILQPKLSELLNRDNCFALTHRWHWIIYSQIPDQETLVALCGTYPFDKSLGLERLCVHNTL